MNPVDVRIASGTFPNERHDPPYVPGKEGVGRRDDGGLVYFDASVEPYGAFAERTLIEAGSGYPVPSGLDPALAVCLGVAGLAAWLPLEWRGALEPGESVLVLGASGVVGQIAVQAAKLLGAGRVVAAARSEEGLALARELGADATVQLGTADLAAALREAAGGDGFDLVHDPLWGEPAQAALSALRPFGRLVHVGQSAAAEATIASSVVRAKPVDIRGYTNYTAGEERKAAAFERMAGHALAGELRVGDRARGPRRRAGDLAAPGQLTPSQAGRRPVGATPRPARPRRRARRSADVPARDTSRTRAGRAARGPSPPAAR